MKESQEKIKKITAEGTSGANSVTVILNGEGEMIKIHLSQDVLKEDKEIIEDLIVAAAINPRIKMGIGNFHFYEFFDCFFCLKDTNISKGASIKIRHILTSTAESKASSPTAEAVATT